mgnify:CR=1 FL=1
MNPCAEARFSLGARRFLLSLALLSPALHAGNAAPELPEPAARYSTIEADTLVDLGDALAPDVLAQVESLVRARHCPAGAVRLYRGAAAEAARILTHACYPPGLAQDDPRFHAYLEYPLTLVLEQDRVRELDLSPHAFMYQSGLLSAVSDVDGDGLPELWLSGSVCECDGEPEDYGPEGCQCDGVSVLEVREGVLSPWPPADDSSSASQ